MKIRTYLNLSNDSEIDWEDKFILKSDFDKQIKGLIMILEDSTTNFIARNYVIEKLLMMKNLPDGINFHPHIKARLNVESDD